MVENGSAGHIAPKNGARRPMIEAERKVIEPRLTQDGRRVIDADQFLRDKSDEAFETIISTGGRSSLVGEQKPPKNSRHRPVE